MRRGAAYFVQVSKGSGGFDQRENADRVGMGAGSAVGDHVADECEVAGCVNFRDDQSGQVRGLEDYL